MKTALFFLIPFLLSVVPAFAQKKAEKPQTAESVLEQGAVSNGKRIGKWNFYDKQKELELTFDYDSSRISFLRPDTTRYYVWLDEKWQLKRLTRAPHLLGSTDQRLTNLTRTLRYPISALREQRQGMVLLSYTVGADGRTQAYTIEHSLSPDCDQEVWRALQALPDLWIPAVYRGRPIASRFYLSVQFKMMDEAELHRQTRDQERQSKGADTAASAVPVAASPRYMQQVEVIALGIERGTRVIHVGP